MELIKFAKFKPGVDTQAKTWVKLHVAKEVFKERVKKHLPEPVYVQMLKVLEDRISDLGFNLSSINDFAVLTFLDESTIVYTAMGSYSFVTYYTHKERPDYVEGALVSVARYELGHPLPLKYPFTEADVAEYTRSLDNPKTGKVH
jgi:hypothetical protein